MLTLTELQKQFARTLNEDDSQILTQINSSVRLSAEQHFAIYQSSVFGSLQNALKDIYPVCLKLVGDDFFLAMANRYVHVSHSYSPDLGDYGATFADFIADYPPANSLPYLADVARLEWAWHRIFSAAPIKGIDFQKLVECYETQGENIIFMLPDSSSLVHSIYPIHRIWEMNQPESESNQQLILEENQDYYFFVWRHELEMRIDSLTEMQWKILTWIAAEKTLGEICELTEEMYPHTSVSELFPYFVTKGWVAGFKLAKHAL